MTLQFSAKLSDFNVQKGLSDLTRKRAPWLYRHRLIITIGSIFILYALNITYPRPVPQWAMLLFPILILGSLLLFIWLTLRWRRRLFTGFQNAKLRTVETRFSISERGYSEESSVHHFKLSWSAFIAAEQTSQGLALLISDCEFYCIPNSAFESAEDLAKACSRARDLIAAHA